MNEYLFTDHAQELPEESMFPKSVLYEDAAGVREFGLGTVLLTEGKIQLTGTITQRSLSEITQVMMYCAKEKLPLKLFINSGGGEVIPGLGIYDMLQAYPYDIDTYCIGIAASMAAVLLAGGRKGHRYVTRHSSVMIHEPLIAGGMGGSASTIEKTAKSILETRDTLNGIIAKHTGKTLKEVNKATEADNWMTAEEAVTFGICDDIKDIF